MLSDGEKARLQMLQETAKLELLHLQQTNQRLFAQPWSQEAMANKMLDIHFAERVCIRRKIRAFARLAGR